MIPELFRIGDFAISPFGVTMALAFIAAYLQLRRGLRLTGAGDDEDASTLVLAAGVAGIVGSKVYYAALYGDWRLLFDRSGLVWYGGFVLAALTILWLIHRRRMPGWKTADAAAPALALGYAIGRIGCFLVGDDYGVPTSLPWGIAFPRGLPPTTAGALRAQFGVDIAPGVPDSQLLAVHPTQLYETAAALIIWLLGRRLLRARVPAGTTALVLVALLSVERFLVELLRAKDDRFIGGLTLAQLISLGVLAVVAVLWLRRRRAPV